MIKTILVGLLTIESASSIANVFKFLSGAAAPTPGSMVSDSAGDDYYERYSLDYGCDDNSRIAGSMKGFIRTGRLSGLPESDPFFKWLNDKLEKGSEAPAVRVKPYYVRCMDDAMHAINILFLLCYYF